MVNPISTQTSCLNTNFSDDALQIKNIPTVKMRHIMGNMNQSKFLGLILRIISYSLNYADRYGKIYLFHLTF
ncbi:MAG: hypothetical protein UZ01_01571 [Candidatus Brocadia sinica]|uniref:Uncharacterized protein n=1 Tax=Candidatus Brocadia sinica JPN1 TaxID=1197129 RepID=A0ABQ0JWA1_9BACT|nr:MAG: hypothetical protein UZ01_01571 [Candidatus Brocadia sinica]GAN32729.1 hypothetical protein BROSI_A1244 [Candidatus Brocadia sinica JPN1]GIK13740.1 MAG: hypothetical protein BroJett002_24470 [Candidatus Brocadia sinica]GJQ16487.1 MAG: hypothetical protein HBSIN01_04460 [Candidatus Brocadia sinica]